MKKNLIILLALILLTPGFILADVVTFRVSYFVPRAMSDLWEIEFENMNFRKSEFQSANFSFGYEYFASRELSIVLSMDWYNKTQSGYYMDYVGADVDGWAWAFDYGSGFDILHTFSVAITPIQASLKLTPLGRKGKFIPYIGGGVGAYLWSVRLTGDMIAFDEGEEFIDEGLNAIVVGYPIYDVNGREENKVSFGFHVLGGFMLPIANRISLDTEVKYHMLTGTLKDWFIGFDPFDLSGLTISLGINYWF